MDKACYRSDLRRRPVAPTGVPSPDSINQQTERRRAQHPRLSEAAANYRVSHSLHLGSYRSLSSLYAAAAAAHRLVSLTRPSESDAHVFDEEFVHNTYNTTVVADSLAIYLKLLGADGEAVGLQ